MSGIKLILVVSLLASMTMNNVSYCQYKYVEIINKILNNLQINAQCLCGAQGEDYCSCNPTIVRPQELPPPVAYRPRQCCVIDEPPPPPPHQPADDPCQCHNNAIVVQPAQPPNRVCDCCSSICPSSACPVVPAPRPASPAPPAPPAPPAYHAPPARPAPLFPFNFPPRIRPQPLFRPPSRPVMQLLARDAVRDLLAMDRHLVNDVFGAGTIPDPPPGSPLAPDAPAVPAAPSPPAAPIAPPPPVFYT